MKVHNMSLPNDSGRERTSRIEFEQKFKECEKLECSSKGHGMHENELEERW